MFTRTEFVRAITAWWSSDGEQLYYGVKETEDVISSLSWFSYDLASQTSTERAPPFENLSTIWQQLRIPSQEAIQYPELAGLVSQSEKWVIYAVRNGEDCFSLSTRTEIWVVNIASGHRTRVADFGRCENIHGAFWFDQERKVLFDVGYEGPAALYVANVQTGDLTLLDNLTGLSIATDEAWAVDPNSETLAILNFYREYRLDLVSLKDWTTKHFDEFARGLSWSQDGKNLYYWWGPTARDTVTALELRVMNLPTGEISMVLDKSALQDAFRSAPSPPDLDYSGTLKFAFSPDARKIALWDRTLWLLTSNN